MTKLTDTQSILLSTASQRDSGSLLPLPSTVAPGGGTAKALAALIKRGFAEERETIDEAAARRFEGDLRFGVFITTAGAMAIGIEPGENSDEALAPGVAERSSPRRPSRSQRRPPCWTCSVVRRVPPCRS